MHGTSSLAAAIAIADYLETYTSEAPLENILRLAEALEQAGNGNKIDYLSPEELGKLIEALPAKVLQECRLNGARRG